MCSEAIRSACHLKECKGTLKLVCDGDDKVGRN